MSFWNLSNNQAATSTGEFDSSGGPAIPNNTNAKACIDEAKWNEYEGEYYISLRWTILDGEYKNRKVFQKIKVNDQNSAKRDKAIRMLAAIDFNAGGHLAKTNEEPTDDAMAQALLNKPMVIKIMRWEIDGKEGNWISKVAPIATQTTTTQTTEEDIPW